MLTRRQFLGRGSATLSVLSLGGAISSLLAQAAQDAAKADSNDNLLVVVELSGGNDGLNTVVPFENDGYYRNRPNLQIAKDNVLRLTDQVGLHPAMTAMNGLFSDGKLAIVQGVGYPEPDRSHARSMEIWHTASTAKTAPPTGWLGRYLDARFVLEQSDLVPGIAVSGSQPRAFVSDHWNVPVVSQLEGFAQADESRRGKLLRKMTTEPEAKELSVGFLRRQAAASYRVADKLRAAATGYDAQADYPGDLGQQLRRVAQVINAKLGVRVFFASQGGYDTHANQAPTHQNLLTELSNALGAFQKDLELHKIAEKVIVMVFSEFGRRADENASGGTDHGAASVVFLAGAKVKGGLAGTYPSLEKDKLGDGGLVHTVDFRAVYATILDKWLGCSAEKVLGAPYPPLDLLNV